MDKITTITEAPDELVSNIEEELQDALDEFIPETLERYPVTRVVLLQVLHEATKRLLKAETPKRDLSTEDSVERSIRREATINAAAVAAYDVIDERCDGSVAEHEYLVTGVLMLVAKKAGMATQRRLQSEDLSKVVKKFA